MEILILFSCVSLLQLDGWYEKTKISIHLVNLGVTLLKVFLDLASGTYSKNILQFVNLFMANLSFFNAYKLQFFIVL